MTNDKIKDAAVEANMAAYYDRNYYYQKTLELEGKLNSLTRENERLQKTIENLQKENTAMDSELYDLESFIRVMTPEEVKSVTERMINEIRQRYDTFWKKHRKDEQNG